jgi:hypothetical protein
VLLKAEVHARTREAIGNVQQAERSTTGHVHDVERENVRGGWLASGFRMNSCGVASCA